MPERDVGGDIPGGAGKHDAPPQALSGCFCASQLPEKKTIQPLTLQIFFRSTVWRVICTIL